ncbi:hypothetical protein H696_00951 [Fonticula alba]|uniref:Uncharacterized protein n=1 Tax=Fonticula alba TaxID=691883 RepID=A0A058ZGB6_FONAL|nr:hypothetical protein H696_00951 [Fonticula alba]KCV73414.1 hypothetical protein H696_00951 [Fonticula alba]|eukprot:XP_009493115.1 hypothetical protein H696_00951 [Fonticula alba]
MMQARAVDTPMSVRGQAAPSAKRSPSADLHVLEPTSKCGRLAADPAVGMPDALPMPLCLTFARVSTVPPGTSMDQLRGHLDPEASGFLASRATTPLPEGPPLAYRAALLQHLTDYLFTSNDLASRTSPGAAFWKVESDTWLLLNLVARATPQELGSASALTKLLRLWVEESTPRRPSPVSPRLPATRGSTPARPSSQHPVETSKQTPSQDAAAVDHVLHLLRRGQLKEALQPSGPGGVWLSPFLRSLAQGALSADDPLFANRTLWKRTCLGAALGADIPLGERALLGALAGKPLLFAHAFHPGLPGPPGVAAPGPGGSSPPGSPLVGALADPTDTAVFRAAAAAASEALDRRWEDLFWMHCLTQDERLADEAHQHRGRFSAALGLNPLCGLGHLLAVAEQEPGIQDEAGSLASQAPDALVMDLFADAGIVDPLDPASSAGCSLPRLWRLLQRDIALQRPWQALDRCFHFLQAQVPGGLLQLIGKDSNALRPLVPFVQVLRFATHLGLALAEDSVVGVPTPARQHTVDTLACLYGILLACTQMPGALAFSLASDLPADDLPNQWLAAPVYLSSLALAESTFGHLLAVHFAGCPDLSHIPAGRARVRALMASLPERHPTVLTDAPLDDLASAEAALLWSLIRLPTGLTPTALDQLAIALPPAESPGSEVVGAALRGRLDAAAMLGLPAPPDDPMDIDTGLADGSLADELDRIPEDAHLVHWRQVRRALLLGSPADQDWLRAVNTLTWLVHLLPVPGILARRVESGRQLAAGVVDEHLASLAGSDADAGAGAGGAARPYLSMLSHAGLLLRRALAAGRLDAVRAVLAGPGARGLLADMAGSAADLGTGGPAAGAPGAASVRLAGALCTAFEAAAQALALASPSIMDSASAAGDHAGALATARRLLVDLSQSLGQARLEDLANEADVLPSDGPAPMGAADAVGVPLPVVCSLLAAATPAAPADSNQERAELALLRSAYLPVVALWVARLDARALASAGSLAAPATGDDTATAWVLRPEGTKSIIFGLGPDLTSSQATEATTPEAKRAESWLQIAGSDPTLAPHPLFPSGLMASPPMSQKTACELIALARSSLLRSMDTSSR